MTATVITPVQLTGTAALVTILGPVPAGEQWRIDLRACNVTNPGADATANVYIDDAGTPANSGYRCRNFPIPYNQASSAPDLEYGLILTEGQSLQISAGAVNSVGFSATGVKNA